MFEEAGEYTPSRKGLLQQIEESGQKLHYSKLTPELFEEAVKDMSKIKFENHEYIFDKKLLDEMKEFSEKQEREMFGMKKVLTVNVDDIPYDMFPEDYIERETKLRFEKMLIYGKAGIEYRRPDPNPFIIGIDPYGS